VIEVSMQGPIQGLDTVISCLPNQVKTTAGTKQMPLLGILQEAHKFSSLRGVMLSLLFQSLGSIPIRRFAQARNVFDERKIAES
jgi:hypothetical protein